MMSRFHFMAAFAWIAVMLLQDAACPGSTAWAGESIHADDHPSISVQADRTSIRVAEPVSLTVSVIADYQAKVDFPPVPDRMGVFDVLGHSDQFEIPIAGSTTLRQWTRTLQLETMETGTHEIPGPEISVLLDQQRELLNGEPVSIVVNSVLENQLDPLKFRDIDGPVRVERPPTTSNAWLFLVAGLVAVLAVAVMVLVVKGKSNDTFREWAIEELENLSRSEQVAQGNSEFVCRRLEQILRQATENTFGISARSATLEEIRNGLASLSVPVTRVDELVQIVRVSEKARFAGERLDERQLEALVNSGIQWIQSMEPRTNKPQNRTGETG